MVDPLIEEDFKGFSLYHGSHSKSAFGRLHKNMDLISNCLQKWDMEMKANSPWNMEQPQDLIRLLAPKQWKQ